MEWETVWLLQALLPVLYIIIVTVEIGAKVVIYPMIGKEYSLENGLRTAFGTGLFFINMYYL